MIHGLDYMAFENFFQMLEIDYHARDRICIALYCDFHNVIVAVSVRVGLFPEKAIIFRIA